MYSIIIPTLNEEKLLPVLLKTLSSNELKEKYNYEIIVSDGGSTDKTIEIAKKYADVIIEKQKNKKQNISIGRNVGAQSARGEIFIFLNGDIILENAELLFQEIKNKFEKNEYLAMTCCVKVFPEEENLTDKIFHTFYNNYFHFLNIIGLGMGRGECHIVRKEIFKELKGYDQRLAAGEDFDLFRRIRKKGKILFDRNLIIYESPRRYRKHGHFNILFTWLINSIYILFAKKSKSKEWEQVR